MQQFKKNATLLGILFYSHGVLAADSLCLMDEEIVFSCPTGKGKMVSVCASKLPKHYIQYRFGQKNRIELAIPTNGGKYVKFVEGNVSQGAHGGGWFMRFKNGNYSYVLNEFYNSPSPDSDGCNGGPCEGIGVAIEKGDSVISKLACRGTYGNEIVKSEENYFEKLNISVSDRWPN